MTEHKFTDEEVIKALECCCSTSVVNCNKCTYAKPAIDDYCANILMRDALDLINRQKAEIVRLEDLNKQLDTDNFNANMNLEGVQYELDLLKQEKDVVIAGAIKEFADRLKDLGEVATSLADGENIVAVDVSFIDKLVEEMTGGDENG